MLSIIGLVIVIVATYHVYKTARDYGRNAVLWATVTFCVGFGLQFIVPFVVGLILAIVWIAQGMSVNDPAAMQDRMLAPATIIGLVCLVLSVVAMWLILKKVSQVPDEPAVNAPPPPPPDFQ
jgi:uncharacterized membrane protein